MMLVTIGTEFKEDHLVVIPTCADLHRFTLAADMY